VSVTGASFLFGRLRVRTRGWLLKGAALFVIALGIATAWQGIRYYLVMQRLLGRSSSACDDLPQDAGGRKTYHSG
jgi:hypothetical protein